MSYSGYEAYTPGQPGHVFEVRFNRAPGTATWTDLSGVSGQPGAIGDQPITGLVRDDALGDLYAGTDFGVLRRPSGCDAMGEGGGQPAAGGRLRLDHLGAAAGVLYAATHGRGAWKRRAAARAGVTAATATAPAATAGASAASASATTTAATAAARSTGHAGAREAQAGHRQAVGTPQRAHTA